MAKAEYQRTDIWMTCLLILSLASHLEAYSIAVDNGQKWGDWEHVRMCPRDFYAYGFSMRVERNQGSGDDSALNGFRLMCRHKFYTIDDVVVESSGHWGDWTLQKRCSFGYLDSFQLLVEPDLGSRDDSAANNINVHCSTGEILNGDGMHWGAWGRWSARCRYGVCGFQLKIETPQGSGDDSAVNDIRMICCQH